MNGLLNVIRSVLFPTQTNVSFDSTYALSEKPWNQRTREEKRLTAPYALGWEEGYRRAYQQYRDFGEVTPLDDKM